MLIIEKLANAERMLGKMKSRSASVHLGTYVLPQINFDNAGSSSSEFLVSGPAAIYG